MRSTLFIILCFVLYVAVSCVDPFNPPVVESTTEYLVVDGIVDLADPEATIKLTRSMPLNGDQTPSQVQVVPGALVTIETENGATFNLPEISFGEYSAGGISLDAGESCRLRIVLGGGEEYVSDPVTYKLSPPIDSVTWTSDGREVEFQVTTHDAESDSRFYRWKVVETTMYSATFNSSLIWDPVLEEVRSRKPEEWIFYCWKTTPFSNIQIYSTKGLAEDAVVKRTVFTLPASSWKLALKYSLLVRQFTMDQSEYNFWTELQKNTESIGTIFDPQPTQVTGNIRSVNPGRPNALGYFSIGRSVEKRIFVSVSNLPSPVGGYQRALPFCSPFEIDTIYMQEYMQSNKTALIINAVTNGGPAIIGYTSADTQCIDCRQYHQGTNERPDFWE